MKLFSITCSSNTVSGGLGGAGGLGGTTPGLGCNPPKPPRGWSGSYGTAGEGWAGGLHTPSGSTTMQNTILAANTASLSSLDVAGTVSSEGFNLIGVTNESSGWIASDRKGSFAEPLDPKLGPLQDNGGPTPTMALLPGSPAIDQGNSSGLTTDQRDRLRTFDWPAVANASGGDGSDIGAFEGGPPALSIRRSGTQVILSWPASGLVFRLQSADSLTADNTWASVSGSPVLSGGIYELTKNITSAQKLYRLINP